jgi:hypothetical protein
MEKNFYLSRGNPLYSKLENGKEIFYFYKDDSKCIDPDNLPCTNCGKVPTKDGYDACLGKLSGVKNACCGHGHPSNRYVQFHYGISVHGSNLDFNRFKIILMKNFLKWMTKM